MWGKYRAPMDPQRRVITIDVQVIAYLGDYLNIYTKSLERKIRELNSQMSQEHEQTVPVNIASSRNPS